MKHNSKPYIKSPCGLLGSDDSPDILGKIVFAADDEAGTFQIYTMNADGSKVRQLTAFGLGGSAVQPSWHPDGQQILFSSFKQSTSIGPALWVMDADGGNQRVLYDAAPDDPGSPPLAGNNARWHPDGTKVVFDLCLNCQIRTNNDIYLFDLETKEVTQLTEDTASDTRPTWSPDGGRIAFVSNRDYVEEGGSDLYSLDINSGLVNRLTETGNAGRQLWYPNGEQLIYWSHNNLYKLYITDKESQSISLDIDNQTGFRPLALFANKEKVLLHIFSYTTPNKNQSLQILDLNKKRLTPIYNGSLFHGADWFVPNEN